MTPEMPGTTFNTEAVDGRKSMEEREFLREDMACITVQHTAGAGGSGLWGHHFRKALAPLWTARCATQGNLFISHESVIEYIN